MRYESERLTAVGDDGKESVIEGKSKPLGYGSVEEGFS
jgi:hypothetical protein